MEKLFKRDSLKCYLVRGGEDVMQRGEGGGVKGIGHLPRDMLTNDCQALMNHVDEFCKSYRSFLPLLRGSHLYILNIHLSTSATGVAT